MVKLDVKVKVGGGFAFCKTVAGGVKAYLKINVGVKIRATV